MHVVCSETEAPAEEEAAPAEEEAAPAKGANMAAIEASIALAKELQAAEETEMLERQAQDAADAKIAIAWHKIEYIFLTLTSAPLSLSPSPSLCRNPDYGSADLVEQYRLASTRESRQNKVSRLVFHVILLLHVTITLALQRGRSSSRRGGSSTNGRRGGSTNGRRGGSTCKRGGCTCRRGGCRRGGSRWWRINIVSCNTIRKSAVRCGGSSSGIRMRKR
jgi:hypothetical protein